MGMIGSGSGGLRYPGNNPRRAPDGYQWRGRGEQGSRLGSYYNATTGTVWRPDLEHTDPIGPHWDYKDEDGVWWRVFPDGTKKPK